MHKTRLTHMKVSINFIPIQILCFLVAEKFFKSQTTAIVIATKSRLKQFHAFTEYEVRIH